MSIAQNPYFYLPSSRLFPIASFADVVYSPANALLIEAHEAYSAYQNGNLQAAKAIYDQAIVAHPAQPFYYACRSLLHMELGDDEGAFYDYQIAKSLDFNYHSFLDWAEQEIEPSAIKLSYSSLELCINDALEAVEQYDYVQAIAIYTYALSHFGLQVDLLTFRGAIYVHLLQYDEAFSDFNLAIELDTNHYQAFLFRAKLYTAIADGLQASQDYDRAVAINDNSSTVFEERGNFRLKNGETTLALEDFDRLVELAPDDFYVYVLRADLHENVGNTKNALIDLDRAILLNPYYSDLYHYRSAVKLKLGDHMGAAADKAKFEELEADER